MRARILVLGLLAGLLMGSAAARAADTRLTGEELLARCKGTPEVLNADRLYCKGYLEGIEDLAAFSHGKGGSAPFCVPPGGVTDDQMREAYLAWAKGHVGELKLPALNAAVAALRTSYPCP